MEIFVYRKGAGNLEEGFSAKDLPELLEDKSNLVWVDLLGETPEQIEQAKDILLNVFRFHHLTVEDCIETRNMPKVEPFPEYLYFIVHGIKPGETHPTNFVTKELDVYLGENYVVTFHIERFRSIKNVKQQIRTSPFICQRGADYLLHQILDFLIDLYMPLVDDFDHAINTLEDCIFSQKTSGSEILEDITGLRRSVARLKRISSRQLDILYRMSNGEFPQIRKKVLPFYRDVYDHLQRISDLSESYKELVAGLFQIHFSVTADKTNEIIKFLTIFSSIILPLSLIAGIYGMNFDNMPELKTRYGYFMALAAMGLITVVLLVYFKHKGWIFKQEAKSGDALKKLKKP